MFKRRDIPPVLLLLLLIILVMLTLSQILVVHNGRYSRNIRNMRRLQLELREMDLNLRSLMMKNVPSIELNRKLLQNTINAGRFAAILAEAAKKNASGASHKTSVRADSRSAAPTTAISRGSEERPQSRADSHRSRVPGRGVPNNTEPLSADSEQINQKSAVGTIFTNTSHSRKIIPKALPRYCPSVPPNLKGRLRLNLQRNYTVPEIVLNNPELLPGGNWKPRDCIARHRVAVIIPYRDRWDHLLILLAHLHPVLKRQQLDYRIYVIEQYGKDTFNKARIMNIAFMEALKQYNFQCFVFHDVDLVPEDDRNMYSCPVQPRHMSVAIDEMGYRLAYQELVGGVLNMRTEHFQRVNGYSNLYWGWGAEDDDMAYRIMHVGLKITRPPEGVARYKMIKHTKRKPSDWRKRAKLLYTGTRRFQFDGLNSLSYKVVSILNKPLFTHIMVDIGKPPKGF